jgi:calcineurin-like phosphoesterase family protein
VRIQIFSDLHAGAAQLKPIAIGPDVDAAVVVGDIAEGAENSFAVIRQIVPERIPVIFVMGNHEYYRRFLGEELAFARAIAPRMNVFLLENDTAVIDGFDAVRFAGASLWTDYRLFGDTNAPAAMLAARFGMNDHRLIGWKREPWARFRPQEAALLHAASRAFFAETFASAFDGITVVVSHHAPDVGSVPARYSNDILSAAFASTVLTDLNSALHRGSKTPTAAPFRSPDFWIHGHIHDSADYRVGPTRVIANPHGYGRENPNFDPTFVIEVPS